MTAISERLKEIMTIRNVKQVDIIEHTGITKGALSSYISGRYEPKQSNIFLLAKYLDVNEAWLMGYDVPMERKPDPQPAPAADCNELRLISAYRSFNSTGKAKLMDYVADLESSPRNFGEVLDSCIDSTGGDDKDTSREVAQ